MDVHPRHYRANRPSFQIAVWNLRTERTASSETWNINRRRDEIVAGYYIGLNPEFIAGGIRTLVGARSNTYSRDCYYERTVTNPEVATPRSDATTPLSVVKFTPDISGFAMYSESLEPQLGADERSLDPVTGKGFDVGVKTNLLDGRLSGTLSYFGVKREDIAPRDSAREVSTARQPLFIYGDTEESQGDRT